MKKIILFLASVLTLGAMLAGCVQSEVKDETESSSGSHSDTEAKDETESSSDVHSDDVNGLTFSNGVNGLAFSDGAYSYFLQESDAKEDYIMRVENKSGAIPKPVVHTHYLQGDGMGYPAYLLCGIQNEKLYYLEARVERVVGSTPTCLEEVAAEAS